MRTYLDCIPCFIRQSLDSVRAATADAALHEQIMREVLQIAGRMDFSQSPPSMAQVVHRRIRQLTGIEDPFRAVKDRQNQLAVELGRVLGDRRPASMGALEFAVRLAIAGNIIDLGAKSGLDEAGIHTAMLAALEEPLAGSMDRLARAIQDARRLLYLTDNAGEIVFDRLLIEQMPPDRVTVAVRGTPVINDATREDAEFAGMTDLVPVIDNGSDAPGTILASCSQEFRQCFQRADLIIAKGQGNYETLCDEPAPICFLLRVKCPVIARDLGCDVDRMVIRCVA